MSGGGFLPPKQPQYPVHADEENVPALPSLLPIFPDIPQPGSSAGLLRSEKPSGMSAVPHPGVRMPNSISPPPPDHVASSSASPSTPAPYPPHTPYTAPVPSAFPGRKVPLLSSVTRTPPLTESPPPGMGGRPCRLSSRH